MKKIHILLFCLGFSLHLQAQLKINEVLYDPSNTTLQGDANGDGFYDQTQDEFIELINTGSTDLFIGKYRIFDKVKSTGLKTRRHTIGNFSIPSNGVIVLFGGDTLGGISGTFGGALVVVDSGSAGLSMGNTDEIIIVEDSLGNVVDSLDTDALSNNPNESYTRNPDITGDYVQHGSVTPGKLFSPGTNVNGEPFNTVLFVHPSSQKSNLMLFPNPTSGHVFVSSKSDAIVSVEVFDVHGRTVSKQAAHGLTHQLSGLTKGMFFVKAVLSTGVSTQKMLVVE